MVQADMCLQTAKMIKFAVTRPPVRREGIQGGLNQLNWREDPYLKGYGIQIQDTMLETQARLLTPPVVQFAKSQQKPGFSGRWRLDGQQFFMPNKDELHSWGICVFNSMGRDQIDAGIAQNFIRTFINTYKSHGGRVGNVNPVIIAGPPDIAVGVETLHNKLVAQYPRIKPQMMVFLLSGKDAYDYLRIKKSCDCRFGIVSQCMQNAHVRRAQAQYISNVLMKFNAKLGGITARVPGPAANKGIGHFKRPTMVIGADVSHAAPGSMQPSMAALTVSMDTLGCRYAAACESNGHRVEMITQFNMEDMLAPLFREWMSTVGKGRMPQHIMYFRDGVSEGQYQHVLHQEIMYIKHIWRKLEANERDHSISDAVGHSKENDRLTLILTEETDQVHSDCLFKTSPYSILPQGSKPRMRQEHEPEPGHVGGARCDARIRVRFLSELALRHSGYCASDPLPCSS